MPAQASLRSLRKLGCERGHDDNGRDSITSKTALIPDNIPAFRSMRGTAARPSLPVTGEGLSDFRSGQNG